MGLEGLVYDPRATGNDALIAPEDQAALIDFLDTQPWAACTLGKSARRVQQYGYAYNYRSRKAAPCVGLPPPLQRIADTITKSLPGPQAPKNTAEQPWNQCIVNEYLAGQGVTWHTDAKCFGDAIACVTLGTAAPIQFRVGGYIETITPEPGSLYVMTGESRTYAQHRMPLLTEGRRVSITFRHVPPPKT